MTAAGLDKPKSATLRTQKGMVTEPECDLLQLSFDVAWPYFLKRCECLPSSFRDAYALNICAPHIFGAQLDEFMFQASFDCSTAATMCTNQEGYDDAPGRPRQETQYFVHFIQSIHRDYTFEAKLAGGRF